MNANQRSTVLPEIAEHKRERCFDMSSAVNRLAFESKSLKVTPLGWDPSRGNSSKHRCWCESRHAAGAFAVLKFGGRFSVNAVNTSFTSAERTREANSS